MTYQVKAVIQHPGQEPREVAPSFAGCVDEADAERKFRAVFAPPCVVKKVKSILPPVKG